MSLVLILGDIHFGKGTSIGKAGIGAVLNSRIVDQLNLLDWTLDQAIELHAKRIIITGDVFEDPKPHPELITLFVGWVNKCARYEVYVDIIMGNHDMLRTGEHVSSPLDIITEFETDYCTVYKDIDTIYVDNVAFTLLPFRDRKSYAVESNPEALKLLAMVISYELSSIPLPYTKVLVGHLAIEGSIPVGDEIDDLMNELFVTFDMFTGYDYVWMGHVHKPQVMRKKPFIAHIGSMDISNFGETDHKKHLVAFDTETSTHYNIEIPTRNLSKITISVPKDTEDTTKFVLDEIKSRGLDLNKSIVKLEIALSDPGLKPMNRPEIEKFLYKEGAFNIAGFSESKKIVLVKKDVDGTGNIDTTMDVAAAVKLWADKKWPDAVDLLKKQKFIQSALDIYNDYKVGLKK